MSRKLNVFLAIYATEENVDPVLRTCRTFEYILDTANSASKSIV
jgi:hypothetical protein